MHKNRKNNVKLTTNIENDLYKTPVIIQEIPSKHFAIKQQKNNPPLQIQIKESINITDSNHNMLNILQLDDIPEIANTPNNNISLDKEDKYREMLLRKLNNNKINKNILTRSNKHLSSNYNKQNTPEIEMMSDAYIDIQLKNLMSIFKSYDKKLNNYIKNNITLRSGGRSPAG